MTPEAISRIRSSFSEISSEPRALASRFYTELFAAAPQLRALFPTDLTSLQGHFEAALALVIRNLEEMRTLEQPLRDLGAQHVHWGAKPEDYLIVREALDPRHPPLVAGVDRHRSRRDWRRAITDIAVPMLQGAAVYTAMMAERLSEE